MDELECYVGKRYIPLPLAPQMARRLGLKVTYATLFKEVKEEALRIMAVDQTQERRLFLSFKNKWYVDWQAYCDAHGIDYGEYVKPTNKPGQNEENKDLT